MFQALLPSSIPSSVPDAQSRAIRVLFGEFVAEPFSGRFLETHCDRHGFSVSPARPPALAPELAKPRGLGGRELLVTH